MTIPAGFLLLCALLATACSTEIQGEFGEPEAEFIHVIEFAPSISGRSAFTSYYLNNFTAQVSNEDSDGILFELMSGDAVGKQFFRFVRNLEAKWQESTILVGDEESGANYEGHGARLRVAFRHSEGSDPVLWEGPASSAPDSVMDLIKKLKSVIAQTSLRERKGESYIRSTRLSSTNASHLRGLGLVTESNREEVESLDFLYEALRHEGMLLAFRPRTGSDFEPLIAPEHTPLMLGLGNSVFEVTYISAGERSEYP